MFLLRQSKMIWACPKGRAIRCIPDEKSGDAASNKRSDSRIQLKILKIMSNPSRSCKISKAEL